MTRASHCSTNDSACTLRVNNDSAHSSKVTSDSLYTTDKGFCRAESRDDEEGYGEYRWSESNVGIVNHQMCIYSGFGDHPMASRPCNEGGVWGDVVYDECFTLSTSMYQEIAIVRFTFSTYYNKCMNILKDVEMR